MQTIPINYPIIDNWSTKALRKRRDAKIKWGVSSDGSNPSIEIGADQDVDIKHVDEASGSSVSTNIKVLTIAKKIATLIVDMMKMIDLAPKEIAGSRSFQRTIESALKPISCSTLSVSQTK